eukprot:CAMPEP_0178423086 /NCGR_PEP_ID=MMETSP0689_2-20121128/27509_1 /TAXON_ID=160604 /ORGANISM="Amphidinium massartii, Strain CS-259" /LENGTH=96 /DNA_ID=CAMNT_0020044673 /DNA_START=339 /DNA_END=629 /DNA_ORIENTATION=-
MVGGRDQERQGEQNNPAVGDDCEDGDEARRHDVCTAGHHCNAQEACVLQDHDEVGNVLATASFCFLQWNDVAIVGAHDQESRDQDSADWNKYKLHS